MGLLRLTSPGVNLWRRGRSHVRRGCDILGRTYLSWVPDFPLVLRHDHAHPRATPTRSMTRTALSIPSAMLMCVCPGFAGQLISIWSLPRPLLVLGLLVAVPPTVPLLVPVEVRLSLVLLLAVLPTVVTLPLVPPSTSPVVVMGVVSAVVA